MNSRFIILVVTALVIFCNNAVAQVKYDTLDNNMIINLTKIGLPPKTIISKIKTSYGNYDVSTQALIHLGSNGVDGDVINELINIVDSKNAEILTEASGNNPLVKRRPGIYYYNPADENKPFKRIDPTVVGATKSGGFGTALAQHYSYGLASNSQKSLIAGQNSRFQIYNYRPEFYFYFDVKEVNNSENWHFGTATSPNEFVLVKMNILKDSREVITWSGNAYGGTSGIPNKQKVDFTYEEVADGIYKVTLSNDLPVGEYFFGYASTPPGQHINNKVFDFGIDTPKN